MEEPTEHRETPPENPITRLRRDLHDLLENRSILVIDLKNKDQKNLPPEERFDILIDVPGASAHDVEAFIESDYNFHKREGREGTTLFYVKSKKG